MIDATQAAVRGLAAHFKKDFPISVHGSTGKPSSLVTRIVEGWSNQRDDLVYPVIEIDAPVAGERYGRTATVIGQQRVTPSGIPTSDPAAPNFIWTVHFGTVEIPLQVRVSADSKAKRSEIDHSIDVALLGDFDNDSPIAVSDPINDYASQVFAYRPVASTRYFDSATTVGRDEFTSLREVEAAGSQVLQHIAPGFTTLRAELSIVTGVGNISLVVAESVTIFDPTTP